MGIMDGALVRPRLQINGAAFIELVRFHPPQENLARGIRHLFVVRIAEMMGSGYDFHATVLPALRFGPAVQLVVAIALAVALFAYLARSLHVVFGGTRGQTVVRLGWRRGPVDLEALRRRKDATSRRRLYLDLFPAVQDGVTTMVHERRSKLNEPPLSHKRIRQLPEAGLFRNRPSFRSA